MKPPKEKTVLGNWTWHTDGRFEFTPKHPPGSFWHNLYGHPWSLYYPTGTTKDGYACYEIVWMYLSKMNTMTIYGDLSLPLHIRHVLVGWLARFMDEYERIRGKFFKVPFPKGCTGSSQLTDQQLLRLIARIIRQHVRRNPAYDINLIVDAMMAMRLLVFTATHEEEVRLQAQAGATNQTIAFRLVGRPLEQDEYELLDDFAPCEVTP